LFVDYSLNRNSVNRFLACLRERLAEQCELQHPFRGTVEVDESYFGPRRVKSKAGRGAGKNTFVFGICKRHGKVYTVVVEDCTETTTLAAISRREDLRSVIHFDRFKSYDDLVDMGYKKHVSVDHSANKFSSHTIRGNHINGQLVRHGLLGVRQYTTGVVQRDKPEHLLLAPQRMRVPL